MNLKAKDPSTKHDQPKPTGKGVANSDPPKIERPDHSEELNTDELAAFKKIMGEIGGQEEARLTDPDNGAGSGEKDRPAMTEAEQAKGKEGMNREDHQAAGIPDGSLADSPQPEEGDDESLDEDQQKAFESIMAQIEGAGSADQGSDSDKKAGDAPELEPADDFSAELEKVAQEAGAAETTDAVESQNQEATDGLDQDQQNAFESIMAQIEGPEPAVQGSKSDKKAGDAPDLEPVADSSAELEKTVQLSEDALDGDQQKAFESIMAQIEDSDTREMEPDPEKPAPTDPPALEVNKDQEPNSDERIKADADDDPQDISDDLDDILKEITSSEHKSPFTDSKPSNGHAQEKAIVDDDIVVSNTEARDSERQHSRHVPTSADNQGAPLEPQEKPLEKVPSGGLLSINKPAPDSLKTPQTFTPLREATKSTAGTKEKAILASTAAIVLLALTGYYYWSPTITGDSKALSNHTDTRPLAVVAATQPPTPQLQEPAAATQAPSDRSRLKTAADKLDRLRNKLLEKQAEIEELRVYYQAGIDAEIQAVIDTVQKTGKGILPLKAAMADPRLSLGLSAIQRRDTYIKRLATPLNTLISNSEELLYFSRRAGLLVLMADKTSDIDVDGFIKQADEMSDLYVNALAQLNIDTVPASPLELESIWQEIEKRISGIPPVKHKNDPTVAETNNAVIWNEICKGDFTRKDKLTALSPEASRCLATWKGKDLFLNSLDELSADAARPLADWEGDWLGLNGLQELSPDAAGHLSRWKGKKLSLNGLSHLSPRVVAILSEWQGEQIELIHVKHMAQWENPKTRLFLSEELSRKHNPKGK